MRLRRVHVIGFVLALAAGGVVWADLQVGDVRSTQSRNGVALREAPKGLAKATRLLPYGTRVSVLAVEGTYARVRTIEGVEGWVRSSDLVEPSALTGGGANGPRGATTFSSSEVSAAGRQFDEETEGSYRRTSANLDAAYRLVDALEGKTPPFEEIEAFVRDGRLGR